jgi:benzoate membrane transport protein
MRVSLIGNALIAVLVGFGGSVAIVLSATHAVGASAEQTASWLTALCLSIAVTSIALSWLHKMPIVTAWSTPGAALIGATAVGGLPTINIESATGAFMLAALLTLLSAAIKPLADAIRKIPTAIAAAMLAGVLIGFSIAVFDAVTQDALLVLPLLLIFLIIRIFSQTWAVLAVLVCSIVWAVVLNRVEPVSLTESVATLVWITSQFDISVLLGLGAPLFLVSMASQNLPGLTVLKAADYEPPARSALAITGLGSLLTAPFAAHTTTLAAITASLCTGSDTP